MPGEYISGLVDAKVRIGREEGQPRSTLDFRQQRDEQTVHDQISIGAGGARYLLIAIMHQAAASNLTGIAIHFREVRVFHQGRQDDIAIRLEDRRCIGRHLIFTFPCHERRVAIHIGAAQNDPSVIDQPGMRGEDIFLLRDSDFHAKRVAGSGEHYLRGERLRQTRGGWKIPACRGHSPDDLIHGVSAPMPAGIGEPWPDPSERQSPQDQANGGDPGEGPHQQTPIGRRQFRKPYQPAHDVSEGKTTSF